MKKKIIVVFVLLLLLSIVADVSYRGNLMEGYIERASIGGEEKDIKLRLQVDDVIENYEYSLKVSPEQPKRQQAEQYFEEAIEQIDKDFSNIKSVVPRQEEYSNGFVSADWSFRPFGIVDESGKIDFDKLENEGTILQAQVELRCGAYEKIYNFPFELKRPSLSKEERILQEIEVWLDQQMQTEGSQKVQLPTEIEGEELLWFEEREFITPQVVCLELLALLLLKIVYKRKQEEEQKKRIFEMEGDYPEIVNQLSLLISVGMTTRQAWTRIATQYAYKRKEGLIPKKRVYEAIVQMNRRFKEGESESMVYRRFTEDIPVSCYRKLTRLLLSNLEKGTTGIALRLEEESRQAFEQKILRAKKLGEEASTKMLLPLMLMLMLVMGVVLLPALMKFQI